MKLLIENFRKYLKEQEEFDPYKKSYKKVVKLYTDDDTLLDELKNNEGDEESAASEIIEGMKNWIEDALGEGEWNEDKALQALRGEEDDEEDDEEGETLQDAIVVLIQNAKSNAQNI